MLQMVNVTSSLAVFLFLYAAWTDFRTWKIPNAVVLALVTLCALRAVALILGSDDVGAALFASSGIGGDIAAGLLMFMLGVALWAFRLFGAGDAKLFLPIGLFIGWHGMMPFAVLLLVLGIVTLLVLRLPVPLAVAHLAFFIRIEEIRASRKIPYGVIMVFATLLTMALPMIRQQLQLR
ncbi:MULTISPECIES: prepilin peptidase [Rhizobium]|uniref:A24 family peptidase n=1 Tax=Rhizobium TaxID=379 RepID=UPI001B33660D|nr:MULTISPECIES: prepilin peptidase [Rhizobium]MBX4906433.1 pilus assembly protein CpaA [Rhizobium bangladeshense]MBX5213539.1 pilus assembly protein CpaA [Rhizobium sp. NLR9a]MBX5225193.1 pilus assembly protein CpaA [Rhizobium sp. NLR9b]MBX5237779.1 pilus assembly protein CpaA [Rhizobium sp. NLR22b]MBX5243804.1 pilus assembly protein CpaA [Rhizobium sp. NLR3b]